MTRIALLICDTPVPAVVQSKGTYLDIFRTLLESSEHKPKDGLVLDGFDVVRGEYPSDQQLDSYDGIMITGSAASAYAPLPWIPPLLAFLLSVTTNRPKIRIIGICFGQQVLARALGGDCVPNEKGWEVGVYDVGLTDVGKRLFGTDTLRIQQMHRDHVPALPPSFQLLGSTPKCAVQGMVLPYSSAAEINSLSDVHVLCLQGHPEFLPEIVQKIIDVREASGVLAPDVVQDARIRADAEHDGVDVVAKTIWGIFTS